MTKTGCVHHPKRDTKTRAARLSMKISWDAETRDFFGDDITNRPEIAEHHWGGYFCHRILEGEDRINPPWNVHGSLAACTGSASFDAGDQLNENRCLLTLVVAEAPRA